ncbi:MAG: serine--tRNA ligase, partial [Thermodesulfovibrionales bacterium]
MLDVRFVRENVEVVTAALRKRNCALTLTGLLSMEDEKRTILKETEDLRNRRNTVSEEIGKLKKERRDAADLLTEMKSVSDRIKQLDEKLRILDEQIKDVMLIVPNIPHESVPVGKNEEDNVVLRTWGEPRPFDFPPLNHWDIAEMQGIIDFDRAAKIAGARFALMKGPGAKLERSLMNFMLDVNTSKGYTEVFPPILVNRESMTGTGQLPKFE